MRMMRTRFGKPKVRITNKYDGKDDPLAHLEKWAKAYGAKSQPEWVHLFCHTLDVIPMNWYLETKLHHGTCEWDILCEGFIIAWLVSSLILSLLYDYQSSVPCMIHPKHFRRIYL